MDTVAGLLSLRRPAKESRRQAKPLDSLREALLADATSRPNSYGMTGPPTPADLAGLWKAYPDVMDQLESTYLKCQGYLSDADKPQARERIFGPLRTAIERLHNGDGSSASAAAVRDTLTEGVGRASAHVEDRAEKGARRAYAHGLVGGAAVSLVLLIAVGLLVIVIVGVIGLTVGDGWAHLDRAGYWALRDVLACAAGGVTGAALSVLLRLSQIERLDYHTVDRRAAKYRLALGWLFAAALVMVIKGGLITPLPDPSAQLIDGGDSSTSAQVASFFWWGAVGMLAGFNERWARNLLTRGPTDSERPRAGTETPSDPTAQPAATGSIPAARTDAWR
ncbi:MAG: hypothetical protein ACRDGH_03155 [Candidatus Limnocylindria bacterium]